MTRGLEERGEKYIPNATGDDPKREAQNAPEGLDFLAEARVNPEDLIGGTPTMQDLESGVALTQPPKVPLTSITGLEHLFARPGGKRTASRKSVALMYLRVSTSRQTHTGADVDEDGNSIATQREHTIKKARQLGATVLREFVEPGASARSIDKRPIFKEMLRFIDEHPEVTHIVAYQRSRMFRSVADSAIVESALAEKGIEIVSAKEDYGKGADGMVMKTITDAFNQWQSQKNGEDISLKMAHKVEQGGSVGRAKLGYLNIRKDYDGRLVNTIALDPVRAPLMRWAFEQYATGEYSVTQLQAALDEQGLTTRPSVKFKQAVVSISQLAQILRDPYYTGVTRYKGELYAGRHEPLISKELFLQVQLILDQRNRRGDRDRIHFHFLKGMIYCGRCEDEGRRSRMVYSQNKGNGGVYEYFVCTAKQRGLCNMSAIRIDALEAAVAKTMSRERIEVSRAERLQAGIHEALAEAQATEHEMKLTLRKALGQLESQEERLIDAIADGSGSVPKLKKRLDEIVLKREVIEEKLGRTDARLRTGAAKAISYLDLLKNPGDRYAMADEAMRRELLTLFFTEMVVRVSDTATRLAGQRTEPNEVLHQVRFEELADEPTNKEAPSISAKGFFVSLGLNKTILVAGAGFEPTTSGL